MDLMPLEQCPACRCQNRIKLFSIPDSSVMQCRNCGLRYLDPCLSPSAMAGTYQSSETLTSLHRFHASYYDYGNLNLKSKTREDFIRGLGMIESFLSVGSSRKILDVGYGNGFFLALAKQRGWEIDGIDTSTENQKLSQKKFGLVLRVGDFETEITDAAFFDAITFWDVIEHLSDPHRVLQKVAKILKPGGLVLVAVPNDQSFLRCLSEFVFRLSGGFLRAGLHKVYLLEHVSYYSRTSLQTLFAMNGFQMTASFQTSTDLAKYSLSSGQKFFAGVILAIGQALGMQNRIVALFHKK